VAFAVIEGPSYCQLYQLKDDMRGIEKSGAHWSMFSCDQNLNMRLDASDLVRVQVEYDEGLFGGYALDTLEQSIRYWHEGS
jgi:hypothetical protein